MWMTVVGMKEISFTKDQHEMTLASLHADRFVLVALFEWVVFVKVFVAQSVDTTLEASQISPNAWRYECHPKSITICCF